MLGLGLYATVVLRVAVVGGGDVTFTVKDSGKAVFRHDSHVDAARPDCVTCHPRRFSILGRSGGEARPAITHDAMEKKGQACGACHGQAAFGFDECGNCHAE